MNPSKRLQPAVDLVQQKADDAAHEFSACQQKVKERLQQLEELVKYRKDYAKGLEHKSRSGLNATQMSDYHIFMGRLNHAIEQQELVLEGARDELLVSKKAWLEQQQRARALESVVTGYEITERQDQSLREQNESDEHALRIMRTV